MSTARHLLLRRLKQMDADEAVAHAAARFDLLDQGPWPSWLDREAVEEHRAALDEIQARREAQRAAKHRLQQAGLWEAYTQALHEALPVLTWRLQPDSPDAMATYKLIADTLGATKTARVQDGAFMELDFPLVPTPDSTLAELAACPVHLGGLTGPLWGSLLALESGAVAHVVRDEMLRRFAPNLLPPDMRDPHHQDAFVLTLAAVHEGTIGGWGPGAWISTIQWLPIRKLLVTFGYSKAALGLQHAMTALQRVLADLDGIGGRQRIQIWKEGHASGFLRDPDGRLLGDDPHHPWAQLALQGAIIDGMAMGNALMVDKLSATFVDGQRVRETYAAKLGNGELDWLSADACRDVFTYSRQTGERLPPQPGRVYRGGPRTA